jgi:hypothetical protein
MKLLGGGLALVTDTGNGITHGVYDTSCGCGEYRCRHLRATRLVESATFAAVAA